MGPGLRLLAFLAVTCVACDKDRPPGELDAALAVDAAVEADGGPDGGELLTWVDFTVTGCAHFDPSVPVCRATTPARLTFVVLAPAPITDYLWSFGDASESATEASPAHDYTLPGSYTVSLTVGGTDGTAMRVREAFVEVQASPLGGKCRSATDCEPDHECVCRLGTDCPASLAEGMCTRTCSDTTACGMAGVCANLKPAPVDDPAPWQAAYCLPSCQDDRSCRPGFRCRELKSKTDASWVKGCFPADLLVDDGGACEDPAGHVDSTRCASGSCVALGARGLCAGACSDKLPCASGASCATFTGSVGTRCLARCTGAVCRTDPWLACQAPDKAGDLGFSVAEATDATYCAPKRCGVDTECGSDGTCAMLGGASFCQ
jgi:PKD repeat protein